MDIDIINNVEIQIKNKSTDEIKDVRHYHNKANRNMVRGIINFLKGNFTYANVIEPDETDARKFIPCFMGFGNGGFNGFDSDNIPIIDENWNGYVDYNATSLVREIPNSRSRIRKIDNTFVDSDTGKKLDSAGDMDSIIFHCEISPDVLNSKDHDKPVYVSEIGLFPNSVGDNMLACVRTDDYSSTQEYTKTVVTPTSTFTQSRSFTDFAPRFIFSAPSNTIITLKGKIKLNGANTNIRFHLDENDNLISEAESGRPYPLPDIVIGHLLRPNFGILNPEKCKEATNTQGDLPGGGSFDATMLQGITTQEHKTVTIPALILQPNDVMSIKWTITVASIGPNSSNFENTEIKNETGDNIENNFDGDTPQIPNIIVL